MTDYAIGRIIVSPEIEVPRRIGGAGLLESISEAVVCLERDGARLTARAARWPASGSTPTRTLLHDPRIASLFRLWQQGLVSDDPGH